MTDAHRTSRSFTAPVTATGISALVPPPPWHCAGWLINVAFEHEPPDAIPLAPAQVGRPVGSGCVHFADWQACTDGHELLDPVRSQYRETIVVLDVERPDGRRAGDCPSIWVDQDICLVRGLLQGWPKKMGRTWMTRGLPLEHPASAPLRAGTRLGASLTSQARRLVEATLTLTGEPGERLGFLATPTIGAVTWPDVRRPRTLPQPHFVRSDMRDVVQSGWHAARADLTFLPCEREEVSQLAMCARSPPVRRWAGLSVMGAVDA